MKLDLHQPVLLQPAPHQILHRSARVARALRQHGLAPCQSEPLRLLQQQSRLAHHIDALCDCI